MNRNYWACFMNIATRLRLGEHVQVVCMDDSFKDRLIQEVREHFKGKIPGKLEVISPGSETISGISQCFIDEMKPIEFETIEGKPE
jgi:hypothetical protein